MRILLLSAYDAVSHRVWREGLVRHLDEHDWTVLTLPPRFFAWRSRGNPLSWVFSERETLEKGYDLIVATSMTDLAELKGIIPSLAVTPTLVYFHENQFAYPERRARKEYQNYKLTNLYTALAADKVLFNSNYNRNTLLDGARELLSAMPDHVPEGIIESIRNRSEVLSVPLEHNCYRPGRHTRGPLGIVWNHRWEHDKAPARLFRSLFMLRERNVPFHLHLLGQRFRDLPAGFEGARERLGDSVKTWGFVEEEEEYRSILASGDLVVSTALHDFQGLAVLEAVAAGCRPLVPDRLVYPEFFTKEYRYPSGEEDVDEDEDEEEVHVLSDHLEELCRDPDRARSMEVPDLSYLSWDNLAHNYREIIKNVSGSRG
jgi:glycosyltransferase involved in cell wall biosynthesis